jgi:hypothetical protein
MLAIPWLGVFLIFGYRKTALGLACLFAILIAVLGLAGATAAPKTPAAPSAISPPVLGPERNISASPANSGFPRIAIDGTNVLTVWADRGAGADLEIYLRHSDNGGASFSSARNISRSPGLDSNYPEIAISGNMVYVVWEEHKPPFGATEAMLAISYDNGRSFGAPVAVSNTPDDSDRPFIAVSGPYVWIIWSELSGNRVGLNLARSDNFGIGFATEHLSTGLVSWQARLAAAGQNVYVVANIKDVTTGVYSLREWTGHLDLSGTFTISNRSLAPTTSFSTDVRVAASGDSVYAFWRVQNYPSGEPVEKFFFSRSADQGGIRK